jgi:CheY-specific phosphatase CheX
MTVTETDIENITRTIWDSLFDCPLERTEPRHLGGDSVVTGCLQINGAWQGAVLLQCPVVLAASLAAMMFRSEERPTTDHIKDALGELANMIAGNVKALLPETSHLSLPAVALGSDYELNIIGTTVLLMASFRCREQILTVTLLGRTIGAGEVER